MNKKIKIAILIVFILIACFAIFYVNDYYHADKIAIDRLNANDNVSVVKTSNGLLLDGPGNDTALIFYPGAKLNILHTLRCSRTYPKRELTAIWWRCHLIWHYWARIVLMRLLTVEITLIISFQAIH